ncbi:MAG: sugar porter family MFS transporter [Spirochaetia bacterium]
MKIHNSGKKASPRDLFVYLAAALSALGGMLFGYDTGVISGAILFIKKEFALGSFIEEIVVSVVLVGAVIGAMAAGRAADRLGRRRIIIVTAFLFVLAALATAVAPTVGLLIAGRILAGIAIGAASFIAPLYISEISPVKIRGKLVSFNQLAITGGIVVSYLVGYALSSAGDWRLMFGLAAIPAAGLGIGLLPMPDSPRWLFGQGRTEKATEVLRHIRGHADVSGEVKEMRLSIEKQSGSWAQVFSPHLRPALIVGIGLAVFQQFTGINTVIYYAPTIFQFAGFRSASAAILATVGVGVVNMLLTVVALMLLDRVGRRPLLLTGLVGMTAGLTVLGIVFLFGGTAAIVGGVSVAALMLYVGSFAVGLGPVFWLMIAEIYPLKVRGLAMSAATVVNWGANLLVAVTFLTLIRALGKAGTFWLYAVISLGSWFFVYFLVPETKGRSLEYIESHWRARKHPRSMGKQS